MEIKFKAPWDFLLFLFSSVFVLIVLSPLFFFPAYYNILVTVILLLLILPFIITGYSIADNKLIIHRPFWKNTFDLFELNRIEINSSAMNNSLRLFGIGGAFSYSGIYSNNLVGKYKAYATSRKKSVVMYFNKEIIIVTPDSPDNFTNTINNILENKKMV